MSCSQLLHKKHTRSVRPDAYGDQPQGGTCARSLLTLWVTNIMRTARGTVLIASKDIRCRAFLSSQGGNALTAGNKEIVHSRSPRTRNRYDAKR